MDDVTTAQNENELLNPSAPFNLHTLLLFLNQGSCLEFIAHKIHFYFFPLYFSPSLLFLARLQNWNIKKHLYFTFNKLSLTAQLVIPNLCFL